jgi:lysophospholipase L1-like esterase
MSEPAWPLRLVLWHFGSGDALFFGWFLLILATRAEAWGWQRSRVLVLALFAAIWLGLSAWPAEIVPWALLAVSLGWLAHPWCGCGRGGPPLVAWRSAVVALVLLLVVCEWPYHCASRLATAPNAELAIVGDSLTAGLEARDRTWPRGLAERTGHAVFDASQQGATVHSAARQLALLDGRGDVLVLLIGGNDILEGHSVAEFAKDLEHLLQTGRARRRHVVLVELPLPPLCGAYGVVQRRLARKYGATLIPKRQILAALTRSGGTVDGVHLSNAGQAHLADVVQQMLNWKGIATAPGKYQRLEPGRNVTSATPAG